MRILLDECVPKPIRRKLLSHDIWTISAMQWSGKQNGELLDLMKSENFEVLLTVDQNLRYQQNLEAAGISVIVMIAHSNRLADLIPLIPQVELVLQSIQPGDVVEVSA